MLEEADMKLKRIAHHEAGHIVIAAARALKLRPGGLCIDPRGDGLACYCNKPDASTLSRERIIVATFAGFYAQSRFNEEFDYRVDAISPSHFFSVSSDGNEVRELLGLMMEEFKNSSNVRELQRQSEQLVEQHWPAIKALASALLAKDWEPLRPVKNGGAWSNSTTAKYVAGEEATRILERYGITAHCISDC